jgi:signal transduction histidine kinase
LPLELIHLLKKGQLKSGYLTELSQPYEKGQLACFWLIEPIFHLKNRPAAYLIIKFSNRALNEFLAERTGLGLTGESYIIGHDLLMRTESRFNQRHPMAVNTKPAHLAFERESGQVLANDYRNTRVLSSFHKVQVDGLNWRILSELDVDEVLRPLDRSVRNLIWVAGLVLSGAVLLSAWISKAIFLEAAKKDEALRKTRQRILYEGQELERTRLSQELHDGIGQLLTALSLRIASFTLDLSIKKQLKEALELIVVEIRRISNNLVPGVLINFGLIPALRNLCMQSSQFSQIQFNLKVEDDSEKFRLLPEVERQLYRVAQESIHNVIQHSNASRCYLKIGKNATHVSLEIKDNGMGMTLDSILDKSPERNKGLASMRDRAESMNGKFQLFSKKGDGTRILVSIPWSEFNE